MGYKHCITERKAELYEKDSTVYLRVFSETPLLSYLEHNAMSIPQGHWMMKIQRECQPENWQYVTD